jgi:hypothetical protein
MSAAYNAVKEVSMPINMRLSPSDDRFFSPDRDLAYCAPHLVHRAIHGLDPMRQEPWIRDYLLQQKIEDEQLVEGARVIAEYMNKTLKDPVHKEPYEALDAAGFFKLPPNVQHIVLAKLGQVFLSAIFPSIRDITRDPNVLAKGAEEIAEAAATLLTAQLLRNTRKALEEENKAAPWWCHLLSRVFFIYAPREYARYFGVSRKPPEPKV